MGKGTTSTSQVTIPPEVLARYNAVNSRAEQVAQTPFQQYSTDPNAFVAPLTDTQLAGIANTNAAANQAQPYFNAATGQILNAENAATPYFGSATTDLTNAQAAGSGLSAASLASLQGANSAAQPLQSAAAGNYGSAYAGAQPYNIAAGQSYAGGLSGAQPYNAAASQGFTNAYSGAQPFNTAAAGLALAGGQAVNPSQIDAASIDRYLSPYLGTVLGSESALLNQNNQQLMQGALGNAINMGAFGGDRSGLAAANLAQQLELANANVYSGILNQGYGQALSTAQQQQGVGLGAAQANRSALQEAAGQLQGIGQQGYAQGTGTAAELEGLGSTIFGQGQTAGQNVQGLGNQVYGQGMGLGAAQQGLGGQLFGQGLSTSQQQADLSNLEFGQGLGAAQEAQQIGTGLYGLGQNTAQTLAGLGTGAQGAALQGAQAQLGAGQAQQQTEQAGLTALYNQFLQQQSYPFQVAQFLANIAEGTGALSGSTTTTTQPGGFFSDERLKEDVTPIGKTHDGQDIVKFRYKGDPRHQIGLLAQDVEKKHPEAVGLAAGYKTVDYDKATKDAERKRGGLAPANDDWAEDRRAYAYGGGPLAYGLYPEMPGLSPFDVGSILAAQEQLYAPYGASGLYGSASAGSPRGGSSYVPAATLPVGHLAVAAPPPSRPSALQQATQIANLATKAAPLVKWGEGKFGHPPSGAGSSDTSNASTAPGQDAGSDDTDAFTQADYRRGGKVIPFRRGGLVPHMDAGGSPDDIYDPTGPKLDIPNDTPGVRQLAVAQPPQKNNDNPLGDIASIGGDFAKILPLIMAAGAKHGGRQGFDDGGDVNDEGDYPTTSQAVTVPISGKAPPPKQGGGLWDTISNALFGNPDAAMAMAGADPGAPMGSALSQAANRGAFSPPPASPAAPPSATHVRHRGLGASSDTAAAATLSPEMQQRQGLAGAQAGVVPVSALDTAPPAMAPSAEGLSPISSGPAIDQDAQNRLTAAESPGVINPHPDDPDRPGLWQRIAPQGGYLDRLTHPSEDHAQALMSLLSGVAAMGTAPTVHPGVALAAGLGAGVNTYQNLRQQQAQIGLTQQEAARQQAGAYGETQRALSPPAGMIAVPGPGPDGKGIPGPDGRIWHYELQVNSANFGNPTQSTPQAAAVAQAAKHGPISSNYATGSYAIGPSSDTDAFMAQNYRIDPSQPGVANRTRMLALNPALAGQDEAAAASADKRVGDQAQVDFQHRSLVQLAQAVNAISDQGYLGAGAGFEDRTHLANLYATLSNIFGVKPPEDVTSALSANQIITKIKALTGGAIAHQYGEKAAMMAEIYQGVLPNGELQKAAADELLSQMMVQNQQDRDFPTYRNAYVQRYGTNIGVEQQFKSDMGPVYDREQQTLPRVMARGAKGGPSAAEVLSTHPESAQKFEQGYKRADGTQAPGFGDGSSRYWR